MNQRDQTKKRRIRLVEKKKKKKSGGKKDACYHKVKARYDVWPSAYASGALSKCRKVGAANWGNKSKKNEEVEKHSEDEILDAEEEKKLKKVQGQLKKSVKAHDKQQKVIDDIVNEGKRKKAGTESSKESSLRDWFGRKGAKGKKGGWVDCNAPDGKGGYKSCGRSSGEKRSKYPSCRPTPGACKEKGKGKSWGKKAARGKKNESLERNMKKLQYKGDPTILETFRGATLDDGTLVCEACLFEQLQEASCGCPDLVMEAKYQGRTVKLNKPMRGDVKKFKVYVKDPKTGNIKKVNFGDPNMKIKKSNPKRRKSFRARHNCDNPGPKTKARYWSCKKW